MTPINDCFEGNNSKVLQEKIKKLEEQIQATRELADRFAHDIKNPLATVLQGVNFLGNELKGKNGNISIALKCIEESAERVDRITKGLLDFVTLSDLQFKPENIKLIISDSLKSVKKEINGKRIAVVKRIAGSIPKVLIDRGCMQQALVNLFLNAVEAMPDGGTLSIRIYLKRIEGKCRILFIEIEDTGCGILPKQIKNIFEPFFTTKKVSGKTGMGLAMVKRIVNLHGGEVSLANKPKGSGARVVLKLKATGSRPTSYPV